MSASKSIILIVDFPIYWMQTTVYNGVTKKWHWLKLTMTKFTFFVYLSPSVFYFRNSVWKVMNRQLGRMTQKVKVSSPCVIIKAHTEHQQPTNTVIFSFNVTWCVHGITASPPVLFHQVKPPRSNQSVATWWDGWRGVEGLILILAFQWLLLCASIKAASNTLAGINPLASIKCLLWPHYRNSTHERAYF